MSGSVTVGPGKPAPNLNGSYAWSSIANTRGFSTTDPFSSSSPAGVAAALPTQLVAPLSDPFLDSFVAFTLPAGIAGVFGPSTSPTSFGLGRFSFTDTETASASSGAGAGKSVFQPLTLTVSDPALSAQLFKLLASGGQLKTLSIVSRAQTPDSTGAVSATESDFADVVVSNVVFDGSGNTLTTLQYGGERLLTGTVDATGVFSASTSAGFSAIPPAAAGPLPATTSANSLSNGSVTYYVRFTLAGGASGSLDGKTLYELSGFSFGDIDPTSIGTILGGAGAIRASFGPLTLTFTQPALLRDLFRTLTGGQFLAEVDVIGYRASPIPGANTIAADYSFGTVVAGGLQTDSSGTSTATLRYQAQSVQTYTQTAAGGTVPYPAATWSQLTNSATFASTFSSSAAALPAATTQPAQGISAANPTTGLRYYVRFTLQNGKAGSFDGNTLYQLGGVSFGGTNTASIGSATGGVGAGKVSFGSLTMTLPQPTLAPELFQMLASGTQFKEVDVIAYGPATASNAGALVADYSFGVVAAGSLTDSSNNQVVASLDYGAESIRTYQTNNAGRTSLTGTAEWNSLANASGFSVNGITQAAPINAVLILPAQEVVGPPADSIFETTASFRQVNGNTGVFGVGTLPDSFALSAFSFTDTQTGKPVFLPLTFSVSDPALTAQLFQYLASGAHFQNLSLVTRARAPGSTAIVSETHYDFSLVEVSDLKFDGSGDTQVTLQYGAEKIQNGTVNADGVFIPAHTASWNQLSNTSSPTDFPGSLSTTPNAPAATPIDDGSVKYYARFTLPSGVLGFQEGGTLYELSGFSLKDVDPLTIGTVLGNTGTVRASFGPLTLSFSQQALLPDLLRILATGQSLPQVDVIGYRTGPDQSTVTVDYSFGTVIETELGTDSSGTSTTTLQFQSQSLLPYTQNSDGSAIAGLPAVWSQLTNTATFASNLASTTPKPAAPTLATQPVSPAVDNSALTYFVRFTLQNGTVGSFDGRTLYQLNAFSFDGTSTNSVGSATGGADGGKLSFGPLTLMFPQLTQVPELFQALISNAVFKEVDVLGYEPADIETTGDIAVDYSFGLVQAGALTIDDSGHPLASLNYGSESLQIGPPLLGSSGPSSGPKAGNTAVTEGHNQTSNLAALIGPLVTPGLIGDTETLSKVTASLGNVTLPAGGVALGGATALAYTAPGTGPDTITYTVTDQNNANDTGQITVTVDLGPSVSDTTTAGQKVAHGTTAGIGSVTPGLPGDTLVLTQLTGPAGAVTLTSGTVRFAAPTNVSGTVALSYQVKDQLGDVTTVADTLAIDPGPVAGAAAASVNFGMTSALTSAILAAVTPGLPGDTETITAIGSSSPNGSETLSNGQVGFTATGGTLQHIPANGSATVSFSDTITDQLGQTSSGTVVVTVSNPATNLSGSSYGNATIQGTPGADVITAYAYNNTINDNGGNDLVNAGAGQATVNTSSGDVIVRLSGQNNTVSGGDGNDTVSGSQGNTRVTLGNGNDTITLSGAGNTVTLGNGTDSVTGSSGNATISVGNGSDTIQAGGNNNTVAIGTGTDSVALNGYGNTVTGGGGADTVSGSTGNATIKLGNGLDVVSAGGSNNTVTTGSGGDTIMLTGGSNLIDAGGGPNMLFLAGNSQETTILHLAGDDAISGFNASGGDLLRLGSLLAEAHVNLSGNLSQLGSYLHAISAGGSTSLTFDATGAFSGHQTEIANLAGITTTLANLESQNIFSLS